MKFSNKLILGFFAAIALNVLTGMIMLKSSLKPQGIGNGATVVQGSGDFKKVKLSTEDFDRLDVEGNFTVTLGQGEEDYVEIEAEESIVDYFVAEVNERKRLRLSAKEGYTLVPNQPIKLHVNFKDINVINSYGASKISGKDTLRFENIELGSYGAGNLDLLVHAKQLKLQVTGAGNSRLAGVATEADISSLGAGRVRAKKLITENAKVNTTGAGDVEIHVNKYLNAKATGAANIRYSGNPPQVDRQSMGASDIHKIN